MRENGNTAVRVFVTLALAFGLMTNTIVVAGAQDVTGSAIDDSSVGDSGTDTNQANDGAGGAANDTGQNQGFGDQRQGSDEHNGNDQAITNDNDNQAGDGGDGGDASVDTGGAFVNEIVDVLIEILASILAGDDAAIDDDVAAAA